MTKQVIFVVIGPDLSGLNGIRMEVQYTRSVRVIKGGTLNMVLF